MADENWSRTYAVDTNASTRSLWSLLSDMARWPEWNAGVRAIRAEGPFQKGTWFSMTLPDGDVIRTQLVDVVELSRFVDETRVGDVIVRVDHQVRELDNDTRRVSYAIEVTGPGAAGIGQGVSADFPDVLASLVRLAKSDQQPPTEHSR